MTDSSVYPSPLRKHESVSATPWSILRTWGVWRDALVIWLGARTVLLVVTYIGRTLLAVRPYSADPFPWSNFVGAWMGWDGRLYAAVAQQGYAQRWQTAFYPLFPLTERLLSPIAGGDPEIAGLLIANAAALVAFALVRALVEWEWDRAVSQRCLLYLAFFPTAFFLAAPYTESLFLFLGVVAFIALRQEQWILGGIFGALAALTRPQGVLLVVPIAVQVWLSWRHAAKRPIIAAAVNQGIALALPLVAFVGFQLYLVQQYGVFSMTAGEQAAGWNRSVTWPFMGFARAGAALLHGGAVPTFYQVHIVLDMVFTMLFIGMTVATVNRVAWPYVAYAGASLLLALMTPAHNWYALGSNMRFELVVFPIFMVLGQWGQARWVERTILIGSLPLFGLFALIFIGIGWIA